MTVGDCQPLEAPGSGEITTMRSYRTLQFGTASRSSPPVPQLLPFPPSFNPPTNAIRLPTWARLAALGVASLLALRSRISAVIDLHNAEPLLSVHAEDIKPLGPIVSAGLVVEEIITALQELADGLDENGVCLCVERTGDECLLWIGRVAHEPEAAVLPFPVILPFPVDHAPEVQPARRRIA